MKTLAEIISRELPANNFLITVCHLSSDDIASQIKTWVSVLPQSFSGTALKDLRKHSAQLAKALQKQTNLKRVPKLYWDIEDSTVRADEISRKIDEEEAEINNI